ncbi:Hypothetical_protein [Hexamita inflata]|uniref:Hypothetical_protein n=2 Tax=Hexamita inflata TaxID=28002 RepID=A0AA86UUX8_9EUKA|nr:Hypothetical protein HINF_LOCUS53221 [Hexamita inflata]
MTSVARAQQRLKLSPQKKPSEIQYSPINLKQSTNDFHNSQNPKPSVNSSMQSTNQKMNTSTIQKQPPTNKQETKLPVTPSRIPTVPFKPNIVRNSSFEYLNNNSSAPQVVLERQDSQEQIEQKPVKKSMSTSNHFRKDLTMMDLKKNKSQEKPDVHLTPLTKLQTQLEKQVSSYEQRRSSNLKVPEKASPSIDLIQVTGPERPGGFQISSTNLNFNEVYIQKQYQKTIYVAMRKGSNYCSKFSIKSTGSQQLTPKLVKNNDFYILTLTLKLQQTGEFRGSVKFISDKEKKILTVQAHAVDQDTADEFHFNVNPDQLEKSKIPLTPQQKSAFLTPNNLSLNKSEPSIQTDFNFTFPNQPSKLNLVHVQTTHQDELKQQAIQQTLDLAQKYNVNPETLKKQFSENTENSAEMEEPLRESVIPEKQIDKSDVLQADFEITQNQMKRWRNGTNGWNGFNQKVQKKGGWGPEFGIRNLIE